MDETGALSLTSSSTLPTDGYRGTLVGRVWDPSQRGPSPVVVTDQGVYDISASFATVRDLCEQADPAAAAAEAVLAGRDLGSLEEVLANTTTESRRPDRPWLLAPVDLQTLKAAGVTFAASMIERVIEERVRGDVTGAAQMRAEILSRIGGDLRGLQPGSEAAAELKGYLIDEGLWSQYLEVGIGPDAEIFTKGPTLSAVGTGAHVGVPRSSTWNNPEPEVALVVRSDGEIVGATLGNDVNLRDVEGRSALLLPLAKDNNASCALGPLVRLFDETFSLDHVRSMHVRLDVSGADAFHLAEHSDMSQISRDPVDLVKQMIGARHQYPDGAVLLLGTLFAPTADRGVEGQGFTHHPDDVVVISSDELGALVNIVRPCEDCDPWTFGLRALMENLAERNLLQPSVPTR
jgi:fumarylacetoacetate (FAA) hydrolase family protein